MRYSPNQSGFSLIELLVVLAILGLLAGLVLPNVLGRMGGAKWKAAGSQLITIQQGIDSFALDTTRLPDSLEQLVQQPGDADFWSGPYIQKQIMKDPWGNDWVFRKPGENGRAYDLVSYGEDGVSGGDGTNKDIVSE